MTPLTRTQLASMKALPESIKASNSAQPARCKWCRDSGWLDGPELEDGRRCPYCEDIDLEDSTFDKEPT